MQPLLPKDAGSPVEGFRDDDFKALPQSCSIIDNSDELVQSFEYIYDISPGQD